jgi:FAD/FMN-containing dehydrogenase
VRATFAALEPHLSGGAYSNFMGNDDARAATVAYGATLERLQQIKAVYDPDNVFRLNQNIEPATPPGG